MGGFTRVLDDTFDRIAVLHWQALPADTYETAGFTQIPDDSFDGIAVVNR